MISYEEFEDIIVNVLGRDISSNKEQNTAIKSDVDDSLFIVAGPGSGKTTVIVLKILKYIFVDDINPNEIISTTFTRKAADELNSRILSWGDEIKRHLQEKYIDDFEKFSTIDRIDFNSIILGTIDSVAEDILRVYKEPGTRLPVIIENFVAHSAMMNSGVYKENRYLNKDFQKFIGKFTKKEKETNPSKMSDILLKLKNQIYYDQANFNEIYENTVDNGEKEAYNAIIDYENELENRNIYDFPMLEKKFLEKLDDISLSEFLNNIKIILVDEYQDTNLIQEEIYFKIAKSALNNGGNITVVGDDDQSLYRFRGATVELFTEYKKRAESKLNVKISEINLKTNYRSTDNIINHCNMFVQLDDEYQNARVENKPAIVAPDLNREKVPIIGLFRKNPQMLSKELSNIINKLLKNKKVDLKVKRILNKKENTDNETNKISIELDERYGSASDIAILTYSPKETAKGNYTFIYYLRKELEKMDIETFNPRGKDLQEIKDVAVFCGLMLECIDPNNNIRNYDEVPQLAKRNMRKWRKAAREFIKLSPEPHSPITLEDFVLHWQLRQPLGYDKWPKKASLMELAYKLITWIDSLQEDVEGIVYLEAITNTITQTGFFNKFASNIYFDENEEESIKEAVWNIFIPIAIGGVQISEELLETLPEDRVNIMSIHQSKGLEFPLVIVDVGSMFKENNNKTQYLRFPKYDGKEESMENRIRKYSSLGISERSEKNKNFDDLVRRYFVAFSRAEDVLILIGLTSNIDGYKKNGKTMNIPNIATGWNRNEEYIGFDEIYLI